MPTKEELEAAAKLEDEELEDTQDDAQDDEENSSAGTKKPENKVPQSRFNEVNERAKKAEKELDDLKAAQAKADEERLSKQGEWQKLAEQRATKLAEATAKAARIEQMEATLQTVYENQLAELPEEYQDIVPEELDIEQRLAWLAKNKAKFMKPLAPDDMAAGKLGGSKKVKLDAEQSVFAAKFNMTPEEYEKYNQD
jgi:chromosome segregation ATPase